MITKVIKVPVSAITKGFITDIDQKDGLKFAVVYNNDSFSYVYAKVTDAKVDKATDWVKRVGGVVMTQAEAKSEIQADILAKPQTEICSLGVEHALDNAERWQGVLTAVNNI